MRLILIRHTEAVPLGTPGAMTDFDRYLTEYGQATAAKIAEVLKSQGIAFDAVLSSPLPRAMQTAAPLLPMMTGNMKELTICEDMQPEKRKPKKMAARLNEMNPGWAALVGHMPDMASLIGWLIGTGGSGIDMAKGAIARIDVPGKVEEGAGVLKWMLTPKYFFPPVVVPVGNPEAASETV